MSTVLTGCQGEDQINELDWGETAETGTLEITPTDIQVNRDHDETVFWDVSESGQEVIIDLEIKNMSDSVVIMDRDFYYESFGVLHEEDVMEGEITVARMDLDIMPLPVYQDDLDEGASIETQIIVVVDEGELFSLAFDADGYSENESYEVSWAIE
ncbi:hypothetical protein [Salisediminibacterium beveridgei]|uniref:hypothetical protein n=1 Tax=Salisediminibacterium beveridgei TaxID=632773 RepID=UPI0012EE39FF|nr:hypothetical protein [Salisediminibacterium beveridgei]